jgi:hypothetical protein
MLDNFPEQALEIAALSKERHERNMQLRKKAESDFAQQLKVRRHRSIPVNPKTRMKNPLWILNQLKTTGEAGVSTLVKDGEAHDGSQTSSDESSSRISERPSDEESDSDTAGFTRQQTLFEQVSKPKSNLAQSGGAAVANSGWNKLIAARRGSLQALPTFSQRSAQDSYAEKRMAKRIAKVEKNTGEMRHLI